MTAPVPPLAALLARIGSLRAVLPMLSALCLAGTGSAMLTTAVSLHLSGPGTDAMAVQLVLTAYPVGFLIGCLIARALVARAGHERSFTLIMLLAGAGAIGLSLTTAQPAWMLFRLLGGMAMSALFVICESWINLYAGRANRGRLFSVYMLTTALAVLIGQLLSRRSGRNRPICSSAAPPPCSWRLSPSSPPAAGPSLRTWCRGRGPGHRLPTSATA